MNRLDLIRKVRALTRDFSNAIFREPDIIDFFNEAIDRISQVIPELSKMPYLLNSADEPKYLPKHYHHLLAVYSSARCFGQDERHYQASTFMNEFEVKLSDMKTLIDSGDLVIVDPDTGAPVEVGGGVLGTEYVKTNNYYEGRYGNYDLDEGVGGL